MRAEGIPARTAPPIANLVGFPARDYYLGVGDNVYPGNINYNASTDYDKFVYDYSIYPGKVPPLDYNFNYYTTDQGKYSTYQGHDFASVDSIYNRYPLRNMN